MKGHNWYFVGNFGRASFFRRVKREVGRRRGRRELQLKMHFLRLTDKTVRPTWEVPGGLLVGGTIVSEITGIPLTLIM